MQPQIVMTHDFQGYHNNRPAETTARLLRGQSWKHQRIVAIVPAADLMPAKAALAMWNLAFPPNNGVYKMLALGMEVGDAYSQAIDQILAHPELSKWEYILTIEHDNLPPGDGVIQLIERMEAHPEYACVGGLYFTKGPGGVAQIWGDPTDPVLNFRPQIPRSGELQECCGTGMGFNLWRLKMFKDPRIQKPFFRTITKNGIGTQDLSFWTEARKYGYRCAIDCNVKVGHYDCENDMVW